MTKSSLDSKRAFRRQTVMAVTMAVLALAAISLGPVPTLAPAFAETEGVIYTCSMHPQVMQDKPGNCPICGMKLVPLRTDQSGSGPAVTIDPVVTQNMGVRVATATRGPLATSIRTVGYLKAPEPNQYDFTTRVSGFIERLYADTEGMLIKQGSPLFDLYSPELTVAEEEALAAKRALDGLPAGADEALRDEASRLLDDAVARLGLWNVTEEDVRTLLDAGKPGRTTTFRSPVTGFLEEKAVSQGSAVETGQRLFRIVDQSTMWLDAQLYEDQLAMIRVGQGASAIVQGLPGRAFQGKVSFLYPQVDPDTRTLTARIVFTNPDLALKPGMYATVDMGIEAGEAVQIPREALIDTGTRQIVFVSLGEGRFEPRAVRTGLETTEGAVAILEGIAEGETVVTSGQFLLDTESRTREAIQKMTGTAKPAEKAASGEKGETSELSTAADAILVLYLPMARALAADTPLEPAALRALSEAAEAFARQAGGGPLEPIAAGVLEASKAMPGGPISEQRKQFKILSEQVVHLVQHVTPSSAVGTELYLLHCPMYPGDWLQTNPKVANPFYGAMMLECGTVEGKIALAGGK